MIRGDEMIREVNVGFQIYNYCFWPLVIELWLRGYQICTAEIWGTLSGLALVVLSYLFKLDTSQLILVAS